VKQTKRWIIKLRLRLFWKRKESSHFHCLSREKYLVRGCRATANKERAIMNTYVLLAAVVHWLLWEHQKRILHFPYSSCCYFAIKTKIAHTHGADPFFFFFFEKPPILQPLKNCPAFYGTRSFINSVHKNHPLVPILSHISPVYTIFPSGFPTNILYAFLLCPFVLHALRISSSLTWSF
jgi:hypothetical protein